MAVICSQLPTLEMKAPDQNILKLRDDSAPKTPWLRALTSA
jgi:hypothetical protein